MAERPSCSDQTALAETEIRPPRCRPTSRASRAGPRPTAQGWRSPTSTGTGGRSRRAGDRALPRRPLARRQRRPDRRLGPVDRDPRLALPQPCRRRHRARRPRRRRPARPDRVRDREGRPQQPRPLPRGPQPRRRRRRHQRLDGLDGDPGLEREGEQRRRHRAGRPRRRRHARADRRHGRSRRRPLPRRLEARRLGHGHGRVGGVDRHPRLADGREPRGSAPTWPTSTATAGPSCSSTTAAPTRSAGGSTRPATPRTAGAPGSARPPACSGGHRGHPLRDRRRPPGADGARRRRGRGAAARGPRRRGQGRRLAHPRPQLPDPRRPRRAAAHRRRAVLLRLRRRSGRPRGQALPHAGVALPEPPLHRAAHADRPLLRGPDLPGRRAPAGRRRHRPVRAVPRDPRRARSSIPRTTAGSACGGCCDRAGTRR